MKLTRENLTKKFPKVEHLLSKELSDEYEFSIKEAVEMFEVGEDAEVDETIDLFLKLANEELENANEEPETTPQETQPKATKAPKAPKQPKAKKAEPVDNTKLVKTISADVAVAKSYVNLHNKKKTYKQLLSVYTKLNKAVVSGAVDSNKFTELLKQMQKSLGTALASMKKSETVEVTVDNFEEYKELATSEKKFIGVSLLARYINLVNTKDGANKKTRAKNLLVAMKSAKDKKKIESQYTKHINTCINNLEDENYKPIEVPFNLNGLGTIGEISSEILESCYNGLGGIVTANQLDNIDFETMPIPEQYRKMIGKASTNASIMLYGNPGGGKTSFVIDFAKNYAEMGKRVLLISKEEGINQTMQEKLRRYNAVGNRAYDNIFITDDIPTTIENYDIVIFDSVQSLQLEPEDLEKWQSLKAMKIYIFQCTKDGHFRGSKEYEHIIDCVLKADNGVITSTGCKNRFGGNGSFKIY